MYLTTKCDIKAFSILLSYMNFSLSSLLLIINTYMFIMFVITISYKTMEDISNAGKRVPVTKKGQVD